MQKRRAKPDPVCEAPARVVCVEQTPGGSWVVYLECGDMQFHRVGTAQFETEQAACVWAASWSESLVVVPSRLPRLVGGVWR
jgi:hypothetical protein